LIVVAAAHRRREALPPPWLGPGALDRLTVAVAVASVPVTSVALVAFIGSGRADTETLTEVLVGRPTWVLVAAGVGFSLVNPLVEEVLFRGLLQTALRVAGLSAAAAIAVQAAAFGAIHLYGVPGGPLGVVMAAAWGAMLGVVRQRSGSIRLPWLVHVAANATMFVALVVIARADGLL
ncbi:MAG: CPBP family intramembrane glutamic endopeptidase, partial [Actinomycetota bacterium]|nr:CPBP family intramembrane glutamic endopeptidase [Actinomycetota bacterium]